MIDAENFNLIGTFLNVLLKLPLFHLTLLLIVA